MSDINKKKGLLRPRLREALDKINPIEGARGQLVVGVQRVVNSTGAITR